jgi:hypothetical protein
MTVATDSLGRFSIKATAGTQLHISYIGYKMLTATLSADGVYELHPDEHALGEVVVTAQEGRSLHTSSVIQRHAMEHLQPSSFADLLELLPGGRSFDPNLVEPNTIHLREAMPSANRDYASSALGTQFVIDGAPISTNANMQYLSGSSELQATSRCRGWPCSIRGVPASRQNRRVRAGEILILGIIVNDYTWDTPAILFSRLGIVRHVITRGNDHVRFALGVYLCNASR